MLKWVQGGVSALTGSAEPIYGPSAFHSISSTTKNKNPFGPLTTSDLAWRSPSSSSISSPSFSPFPPLNSSSHVETQTFYFTSPTTGHYGFVQIIYANPLGLGYTAQLTCRIVHDERKNECVWVSENLTDVEVGRGSTEFRANGVSVRLNKGNTKTENGESGTGVEDGSEYTIKAYIEGRLKVDLKVTRVSEGFKIGKTGTSLYGTDPENPWGLMRHVFWPRAHLSGTFTIYGENTEGKEDEGNEEKGHITGVTIELNNALSMYVMALQGMKPHHAASKWDFVNFQSPTLSFVVMNFTTPQSYGSSSVHVGAITHNNKLICTSTDITVQHLDPQEDKEVGWKVPKKIEFEMKGVSPETSDQDVAAGKKSITGTLKGTLDGNLVVRVDVMDELPGFVKKFATNLSGTNPYIYQFSDKKMRLTVVDAEGNEIEGEGHGWCETTFISRN